MSSDQALRDGDLKRALAELQEEVSSDPSSAELRVFLFQLLSVLGRWDRALTQLDVARDLDAGTLPMVQMYREAVLCEKLRAEVFSGKRSPLVFGEPDPWIALIMEALRLDGEGQPEQAQRLRDQAFEDAPASPGTIVSGDGDESAKGDDAKARGEPFEWIADADPRLGPILEAVVNGRYYWVPLHRIREINVDKPADLRDLVWMPAHFTWTNEGETVGLIPTRYVGSESSDDPQIQMARRTEWIEQGGGLFTGLGQRLLATDSGEYPIMDARQIRLDPVPQESSPAEPPATGSPDHG